MTKPNIRGGLLLAMLATAPFAHADGVAALHGFLQGTRAMQASFEQTVYNQQRKVTQRATGTMAFERPGRFRWDYRAPYAQVLVGDGHKLWMYDPELNQVTVRALNAALGSSPAALLAGRNEIEKEYALRDERGGDGLDWVSATPKRGDSGFRGIRLGFRGKDLAAMDLQDNFGQTTVITFSHVARNAALPASRFVFNTPKGADVIGE